MASSQDQTWRSWPFQKLSIFLQKLRTEHYLNIWDHSIDCHKFMPVPLYLGIIPSSFWATGMGVTDSKSENYTCNGLLPWWISWSLLFSLSPSTYLTSVCIECRYGRFRSWHLIRYKIWGEKRQKIKLCSCMLPQSRERRAAKSPSSLFHHMMLLGYQLINKQDCTTTTPWRERPCRKTTRNMNASFLKRGDYNTG